MHSSPAPPRGFYASKPLSKSMRRPSARRPSLCARRDARKKFRANALEWTVLIVVGVAAPCASFQFGQLIGHKLFPEQQYNDAHATCNANPKDQIFVRSASDPFSAIQPDATPAPVPDGAPTPISTPTAPKKCQIEAHDLLGLSPAAAAAHSCR